MSENNTNVSGRQGVTDSAAGEVAEVSKSLIQGMAPAEKGWILGFICVVAIIVLSDMWVSVKTLEANKVDSERLTAYFIEVEGNRAEALERQAQFFGDQVRRSQEVIRDLAHAVARDSERAGMAALSAIDRTQVNDIANDKAENMTPVPEGIFDE